MIISAALLALVMPRSASALAAYAQTASASPLTPEALDNATYQPVATEAFGDSPVQLTNGSYSSIWHEGGYDQPVTITQSSIPYAFGDLNGDGADDAAAIELESTTGTAQGYVVVLAVYVNDGGTPEPAVTVGLPVREVTQLTINRGAVTILGKQLGPNDAFCCPSVPVALQFMLQGNQLVDVSGTSPTTGQSAPAPSTTPAGALALENFQGAVLMLPLDEQPYSSWPFQGIRTDTGAGYIEYAGDPLQGIGSDVLSIEASFGPPGYDPRSDFKPVCQPATPYCYFPPFGQSSGTEIFNGLKGTRK